MALNPRANLPTNPSQIIKDSADPKVSKIGDFDVPAIYSESIPSILSKLARGLHDSASKSASLVDNREDIQSEISNIFKTIQKQNLHLHGTDNFSGDGYQQLALSKDGRTPESNLLSGDAAGTMQNTLNALADYIEYSKLAHAIEDLVKKSREEFVKPTVEALQKFVSAGSLNAQVLFNQLQRHIEFKGQLPKVSGRTYSVHNFYTLTEALKEKLQFGPRQERPKAPGEA